MKVHKRGGLWFIAIGRLRVTVCVARRKPEPAPNTEVNRRYKLGRLPPRHPVPATLDAPVMTRYGVYVTDCDDGRAMAKLMAELEGMKG